MLFYGAEPDCQRHVAVLEDSSRGDRHLIAAMLAKPVRPTNRPGVGPLAPWTGPPAEPASASPDGIILPPAASACKSAPILPACVKDVWRQTVKDVRALDSKGPGPPAVVPVSVYAIPSASGLNEGVPPKLR
jgi:hypothetical protein